MTFARAQAELDIMAEYVRGDFPKEIIQKFGRGFTFKLVVTTPVDEGTARSNWNGSAIRPDRTVRDTTGKSGAEAIQRILGSLERLGVRQSFWWSNNLAYIRALSRGSSRQQPTMFPERAVQRQIVITEPQIPPLFELGFVLRKGAAGLTGLGAGPTLADQVAREDALSSGGLF